MKNKKQTWKEKAFNLWWVPMVIALVYLLAYMPYYYLVEVPKIDAEWREKCDDWADRIFLTTEKIIIEQFESYTAFKEFCYSIGG